MRSDLKPRGERSFVPVFYIKAFGFRWDSTTRGRVQATWRQGWGVSIELRTCPILRPSVGIPQCYFLCTVSNSVFHAADMELVQGPYGQLKM